MLVSKLKFTQSIMGIGIGWINNAGEIQNDCTLTNTLHSLCCASVLCSPRSWVVFFSLLPCGQPSQLQSIRDLTGEHSCCSLGNINVWWDTGTFLFSFLSLQSHIFFYMLWKIWNIESINLYTSHAAHTSFTYVCLTCQFDCPSPAH